MRSQRHISRLLAAALAALVLAAAPAGALGADRGGPTARAATHRHGRLTPASAFLLSPYRSCLSSRGIAIGLRRIAGLRWVAMTVRINGTRVAVIGRAHIGRRARLARLPLGRFVLSITARTSDGRSVTATVTYETCAGKTGQPGASTQPGGHASAPTPPAGPSAGSYSGTTSQGSSLRFYVSPDGTQVQDITVYSIGLACAPGGNLTDYSFAVPTTRISADGSFAATTTESAVIRNYPAQITLTFAGHFDGAQVAGTLAEQLTYNGGPTSTCMSNSLPWAASRGSQGLQSAGQPPAGSYSGTTSQGSSARFYVSSDGTQLQDISIYSVGLGCTPGGNATDYSFDVPSTAIAPDRSFSVTKQEDGDRNHAPASITSTFAGHFHGVDANGVMRVAGQLRENVTYNDGTAYTCTSNVQSWSATRETQGAQTLARPLAGSYAGTDSQGSSLKFTVSADSTQLQGITLYTTALGCSPGGDLTDYGFAIPAAAIGSDGSFEATVTHTGVENGSPAKITYAFSGHFHGASANGAARVAGQLRADITYDNGTVFACTSEDQSWSAIRAS